MLLGVGINAAINFLMPAAARIHLGVFFTLRVMQGFSGVSRSVTS